jgi:hypothetical protein
VGDAVKPPARLVHKINPQHKIFNDPYNEMWCLVAQSIITYRDFIAKNGFSMSLSRFLYRNNLLSITFNSFCLLAKKPTGFWEILKSLFFSGSCSETEVSKQLYYIFERLSINTAHGRIRADIKRTDISGRQHGWFGAKKPRGSLAPAHNISALWTDSIGGFRP